MKQSIQSKTDWGRVIREYDEDAPIPFDDEDRAEGLYDPNNDAEVEDFFKTAVLTHGVRGPQKAPTKKLTSLRLSQDVLAHYKAKGKGWQAEMDHVLRKAMGS